uniref:UPF3A regulator of nonsense mediated mRNA decay n=1 Tax=Marmota marmota marmota TaxID=9994 RepID=A0A8C5ZNJ9_MARMA
VEAKTRELLARRTTPLLEYIKNRKLEKQRIREEKREERRRRELEKKRLWEEEKRKRKEEETCKRKEADKQKKTAEKEVKIQLLKKPEKGEESTTEKPKERGEEAGVGDGRREAEVQRQRLDGEQRDLERRPRGREAEMLRCHLDSSRKHGAHSEFARFARRNEDELRWVRGSTQDRGKKGRQDGGIPMETAERLAREKEDNAPGLVLPQSSALGRKGYRGLRLWREQQQKEPRAGPEKRQEAE